MRSSTIFTFVVAAVRALAGPTVKLKNGTYEGYSLSAAQQDHFLGMPFAQPPVGDLRFREPQGLNETWHGRRKAVEFGNACMQYVSSPSTVPMSEDCLTINVFRPTLKSSRAGKSLPVAVWFYGGGLYSGVSASYNMTNFVQQSVAAGKPVIGITLNYRLSAFGFLWGSAELNATGSANNGLRDQRLALHWIQENINAFGGDPTKVTIFGQSAGGLSAGKQLIAYGGRDDGLFRGAILQSGGMAEKWPYNIDAPISYTTDLYQNLTITTGCAGQTSELECLRSLPLEELSKALNVSRTPVFSGTGLGPWLTVVDGDFLQDGPTESLIKGHFNKVPIIYTTTTDEATVFGFSGPVNTNEEFRRFVAAGGPDEDTVAMIETLYPNVDALGLPAGYSPPENDTLGLQYKRVVAYHTDAVETSSRRLTVDTWAASGETAYSGRVNILIPGSAAFLGCPHATEVDFVFDVIDNGNKAMKEMAKLMSRTWASFVHDLDPNNHGLKGYPKWPVRNNTNSAGVGKNFVFHADGKQETKSYVELDDYRLAQTLYIQSIFQSQLNY